MSTGSKIPGVRNEVKHRPSGTSKSSFTIRTLLSRGFEGGRGLLECLVVICAMSLLVEPLMARTNIWSKLQAAQL